jgi:hypothetical protein
LAPTKAIEKAEDTRHLEAAIEFFYASPPMRLMSPKPPGTLLFYVAANTMQRLLRLVL